MPAVCASLTAPPKVTLRSYPGVPYDGAIAAARTCYSPRVIERSEITDKQRDSIGPLTFEGGHHTVFQHAHFEFGLENISRQLVWSVLHSYPFYNSEQSSQRYVKLNEPRALVPPITGEALDVYEQAVLRAWDAYATLSDLLKDDAWAILKELRYVRPTNSPARLKTVEREAEKKAIETARYVIPIGAFTSMVHTVSGIVLHRLHRMLNAGDVPYEAAMVIGAMVDLVKEVDPMFFEKVGFDTFEREALPELAFPAARGGGDAFAAEFDRRLGSRVSRLRDWSAGAERVVADAVRATFGLTTAEMDDAEAIDRVMNPAKNKYRVDMLDVAYHSPMMRALNHASYVFEKRLSHTADSQDQRHRMVPASRPMMTLADTQGARLHHAAADPPESRRARGLRGGDGHAWAAKNRLLALGVPLEFALVHRAECEGAAPGGIGLVHRAAAQVDAAHLLQRAGRDLPGVDGRDQPGQGNPPAARALPRPAVRAPQQDRVAALHGRHALLRRAGLEFFPERRTTTLAVPLLPWIAHFYTATGTVWALLATAMTFAHNFRAAFIFLVVATFVDSTDGVLARAFRVKERTPEFDGALLDNIIDYMTYVFVPALIVWQADLVPVAFPVCAAMLMSSAYGFAHSAAKVEARRSFLHRLPVVLEHRGRVPLHPPDAEDHQRDHPGDARRAGVRAA